MNILVIGFGSIGQRHMTNLLSLYPKNNYFVLKHSDNDDVIQNCSVINNETIYTFYDRVEFIRDMNDYYKLFFVIYLNVNRFFKL